MTQRFKPPGVPVEAGMPGYNEYGVPLHACNGYIQDAHYWAWIAERNFARAILNLLLVGFHNSDIMRFANGRRNRV